jgi:hypothetical protein
MLVTCITVTEVPLLSFPIYNLSPFLPGSKYTSVFTWMNNPLVFVFTSWLSHNYIILVLVRRVIWLTVCELKLVHIRMIFIMKSSPRTTKAK